MRQGTTGCSRRRMSWPGCTRCGRGRAVTGQALIEYILMTAMLATLSVAFAKFYGKSVFGNGLRELPAKLSACVTHPATPGARTGACQ